MRVWGVLGPSRRSPGDEEDIAGLEGTMPRGYLGGSNTPGYDLLRVGGGSTSPPSPRGPGRRGEAGPGCQAPPHGAGAKRRRRPKEGGEGCGQKFAAEREGRINYLIRII